jgi:hypothetical protein
LLSGAVPSNGIGSKWRASRKRSRPSRVNPWVPTLLQAAFDAAEPGADYVVPMARRGMSNLRTTFTKIVTRAGLVPWPRLFHNLRASCATELCDKLPNHVVARWMGHSPLIAAKHYLQTNDAHFDLAIHGHARPAPTRPSPKAVANSVAPVVAPVSQNPAQRLPAPNGAMSQKTSQLVGNTSLAQRGAANAKQAQKGGMGATGLEPVTSAM